MRSSRIIHNPYDELSLNRIIDNMPIGRGIGPKAIDSMQDWSEQRNLSLVDGFAAAAGADGPVLAGAARSSAQRLGFAIAQLRELEKELTLSQLFDALVDKTGFQAAFNHENEEDLERWANVLELRNDLEDFDALAPGEALAAYLDQVQLVSDADTMKDEAPEVTLITLHSAKGLEFPVVFIAGVEEGLLPVSRAIEAEMTDPNAIEEERRLFYVGITRAEKLLYLTHMLPDAPDTGSSTCPFLHFSPTSQSKRCERSVANQCRDRSRWSDALARSRSPRSRLERCADPNLDHRSRLGRRAQRPASGRTTDCGSRCRHDRLSSQVRRRHDCQRDRAARRS
ncbi:MAG: 3'-5' exonuclease [Thermomicrobiales bacterium]